MSSMQYKYLKNIISANIHTYASLSTYFSVFFLARNHKFGRQGQAGPDDEEGGDYTGYGYYSGTSNDYSAGRKFSFI